ncbi:MAG: hypothetical protein ACTH2J_06325 [Candidatus Microbacterium stercoravium]|uniref:hypothetical protein n=1 Tax=Microbacterium sp. TaxID=51671 RepID=UPI003F9E2B88
MKKSAVLRGSAIALGAALLVSAGSAAMAADEESDTAGVDVNVEIEPLAGPGALALTVAGDETSLTEAASEDGSALERTFTGALPTVTVTDTRAAEDIEPGSAWYVLGSASSFVDAASDSTIGAEHLGWSPQLVDGAGEGEDFVEVGGDVAPNDPGLLDQELLYLVDSEAGNAGGGVFSANADLTLKVPADVAEGTYTSTVTLSLFE